MPNFYNVNWINSQYLTDLRYINKGCLVWSTLGLGFSEKGREYKYSVQGTSLPPETKLLWPEKTFRLSNICHVLAHPYCQSTENVPGNSNGAVHGRLQGVSTLEY